MAREHGFESWPQFAKHIEAWTRERSVASLENPLAAFIEAACVPRDSGHASGTLEQAEAILAAYSGIATSDIHAAAILGDDAGVRWFLALDPQNAIVKGGPRGWDALTHLVSHDTAVAGPPAVGGICASAEGAARCSAARIPGGWSKSSAQSGVGERAYGAAGIARHAELTLFLERGADPNDEETLSHRNIRQHCLEDTGQAASSPRKSRDDLLRKTDWRL
jgi:hypothetical protein